MVMNLIKIMKFCDATLERVLKKTRLKTFEIEFWKKAQLLLGELDLDIMKVYEREITKRLRHREQMRSTSFPHDVMDTSVGCFQYSNPSDRNTVPHLCDDSDVFQKYSDLCGWGSRFQCIIASRGKLVHIQECFGFCKTPEASTKGISVRRQTRRPLRLEGIHAEGSSSGHGRGPSLVYDDLGDCAHQCRRCGAAFWYGERLKVHFPKGLTTIYAMKERSLSRQQSLLLSSSQAPSCGTNALVIPARLVDNGSSQQVGIDCDETFSPVVKPATIRIVLSLAVSRKWPIHQLDVNNAFLNGDLSKTVYMHQPPGFVDPRYPHHVCLLQKSLYDLKQAPRAWFQRFTASSTYLLQQVITSLHNEFDMTNIEALNYFLGISITRHSTGLFLSQKQYAIKLLAHAHMTKCNPSRTPVDTNSKLGPEGVPVQDTTLYHSLAGGLQYLTFTRPDISYASWSSKRQQTISRSSAEAEYRGVANVIAETAWLRNLLRELHSPLSAATLVYCDNVNATYLSANPVQHQ
nr:hypothetical protein [Tanacetum cinerariifolium]